MLPELRSDLMLLVRSFKDNESVLRQVQNSAPWRSSSPRCFKTGHVLRRVWSRFLSFFCNFYEPKLVVPANKKQVLHRS